MQRLEEAFTNCAVGVWKCMAILEACMNNGAAHHGVLRGCKEGRVPREASRTIGLCTSGIFGDHTPSIFLISKGLGDESHAIFSRSLGGGIRT